MTSSARFQQALRALPGLVLVGAVAVMGGYALWFHESRNSQLEGRALTELELPTLTSLTNSEWMDTMDAYMDDRVPGRDALLASHARVKTQAFRDPVVNDVYVGHAAGQLLEMPPALMVRDTLGAEARALARAVAPAPVLWVYAPRKEEIYADALPPAWPNVYPHVRSEVTHAWESAGDVLDLTDLMRERRVEGDAYFRTDHHWTAASARLAATAIGDRLAAAGVPIGTDDRAYVDLVAERPFYGSTGRRVTRGVAVPDAMVVPVPEGGFAATLCIPNECGLPTLDTDRLHRGALYGNRYRAFLGGERGLTVITNDSPAASGRVMLLKDSFGSAVATYLAERVAQLMVIDERHYDGPTLDVVAAQFQPDAVVVVHNPLTLLTPSFEPSVWTDTSPAQSTAEPSDTYETATYDDVAVVTTQGLLLRRNHDQPLDSTLGDDAQTLADALAATGAPQVWVYAPRKEEVFAELVPQEFGNPVADKRPEVLRLLEQGHPVVDLTPALAEPEARDRYYFRTDHHWTAAAAEVAVDRIVTELAAQGVVVPRDSRVWREVEGPVPLQGSDALLIPAGAPAVSEPMWYLVPDGGFRARLCKDACTEPGLVEAWITNPDPVANRYYGFLGGGFRDQHLHNDSPQASGTLVMLKDSYSHPVALMLAERVTDLYLVDERGFEGSLADFVREVDADGVVMMHNQVTLLSQAFNREVWRNAG